jgi:hypothetical protein
MTDGRLLPFLALAGLLAAKTTTGSRGVVRRGREKTGPLYEVIGMTGDNDPLENGGGVIFKDLEGRTLWWTWSSVKAKRRRYDVYQVDLDPDNLVKQADFFNWNDLADAMGVSMNEAKAIARHPFAMERMRIPEAIGTIHGLERLDAYPQEYTYQELVDRFFR